MLSAKYTGNLADTGKKHFQTKQNNSKPAITVAYNKSVGGVNNLSRVIVTYYIQRKGLNWYHKITKLFIENAMYNPYIA